MVTKIECCPARRHSQASPAGDTEKRRAKFPPKLKPLFRAHRYKVIYGGRGSSKSWSVARALLILGASRKFRILCTREIQKSIKASVHQLLKDQVSALGYGDFYEVLDTVIRGRNGTEFLFAGLSDQTETSIKSYEGVDITWCEEAQTISKNSWDILIPTIRKEIKDEAGNVIWTSEIWITFNPILESDETYKRFVLNPPPDAVVIFLNYYDNPWFPDVLEAERLHCEATEDSDTYMNIWEGTCRAAVAGAIYAKEVALAVIQQRVTFLPYDPQLKVHTIWDLGYADHMAVIFAQRARGEVRVIDYMQETLTSTRDMGTKVKARGYNLGRCFLPHDGFNADRRSGGKSDAAILTPMGFKVKRIPKTTVEARIKSGRDQFHRFVFDKGKCGDLLECLKRYRRADSKNDVDTAPVHDEFSHGSDVFGYSSQIIDEMTNEDEGVEVPAGAFAFESLNSSMGY